MAEELNPTPPNPPESNPQYTDEEISKILNTSKATREERKEAQTRAKELEQKNAQLAAELDKIKQIDPQRYAELEELAQGYEDRKLEEAQKFQELKERWGTEKQSLVEEKVALEKQLQETRVTNRLEKSFYAVGGRTGKDDDGFSYFDLIRERAAKYIQQDEKGKLFVIDPRDGTQLKDSKGSPYGIDELMLKLRSSGPTAALFEADNSKGGGSRRSSGTSLENTRESLMQLPRAERLAKARALNYSA